MPLDPLGSLAHVDYMSDACDMILALPENEYGLFEVEPVPWASAEMYGRHPAGESRDDQGQPVDDARWPFR
jgi:hypothetical protein